MERLENIAKYGYTPVPRDPDVLFKDHPTASGPSPKQDACAARDFPLPDSPLVRAVEAFAKVCLGPQSRAIRS